MVFHSLPKATQVSQVSPWLPTWAVWFQIQMFHCSHLIAPHVWMDFFLSDLSIICMTLIVDIFQFMQTHQWHLVLWSSHYSLITDLQKSLFFPLYHFSGDLFLNILASVRRGKDQDSKRGHSCSCRMPAASLSHATKAYLSFADDKEGVSSCTLSDNIFPIFIVGLKYRNNTRNN